MIDGGVLQIVAVTDPITLGFGVMASIGVMVDGRLPGGRRRALRDRRGRLLRPDVRPLRPAARGGLPRQRAPAVGDQRPRPHRARACATPRPPSACACTSRPTTTGPPDERHPPALLHPFAKPAATDFVRLVRGEGAIVWDDAGKRYVDAMASLWYCNVGHGRTEIADAVAAQMRELETYHCFEKFAGPGAEELAERLAALAPVAGQPGLPHQRRLGGGRHGDQAQPRRARAGRAARPHDRHQPGAELPRRDLRGDDADRAAAQLGAASAPGIGDVVQVPRDDLDAVRAVMDRAPGPGRRGLRRAGDRRRRGLAAVAPGYLQGLRDAVRRARRAPGPRRGHLRVRPARQPVRAARTTASRPT